MSKFSRRDFLGTSVGAGLGAAAVGVGGLLSRNGPSGPKLPKGIAADATQAGLNVGVEGSTVDGQYAFTKDEYRQRIERTRRLMQEQGLDTLYVTSPEGMCYYSGYSATWYRAQSTSSWPALAVLVINVDEDEPIHYDTEYEARVHEATSVFDSQVWIQPEFMDNNTDGGVAFIVNDLKRRGWVKGAVGMEMMSHIPNPLISAKIKSAFERAGANVTDASLLIRRARRVKSAQEIAYTEQAARIADLGHRAIADSFYPGITALELHGNAMQAMMAAGGELPGINQGVVSGPLASAHAYSSRIPIQKGEMFSVDLSGVVNRYHANVCRSYVVGDPSRRTIEMSQASGDGIKLLCQQAKAGTSVLSVSKTVKEFYIESGVWDSRQYIGGYELGIAFPPDWVGEWNFDLDRQVEQGVFEAGLVTNFESVFAGLDGVLNAVSGKFAVGVNIDTILYGEDGTRSLSGIDFLPIVVA